MANYWGMHHHTKTHRTQRLGIGGIGTLALLIGLAGENSAHAEVFHTPWELKTTPASIFSLAPEFRFGTTRSNFDQNGDEILPTNLDSLQQMFIQSDLGYGLSEAWSVHGILRWERVKLNHATQPGTSFGLGDQTLGSSYRIATPSERLSFFAQLSMDFAAYNNSSAETENRPPLGDQTLNFGVGGFGIYEFYRTDTLKLRAIAGSGVIPRSGPSSTTYSALIPWSIKIEGEHAAGISAHIMTYGIQSVSKATASASTLNPCTGTNNGGSCYSGSENPMYTGGQLGIAFRLGATSDLHADLNIPIYGKMAPKGSQFLVGFKFLIGESGSSSNGDLESKNRPIPSGNRGFVNYSEFSGTVTKVNDRLSLVKIDKGTEDRIEAGDIFDIFSIKPDGTIAESIARARVESVKSGEAALRILEFFKEVWIEEGFIVKRPIK